MPCDTNTRWTVTVSKETDVAVRSFLALRGLKKGDLSKFIENAVKWRVFDHTLTEARKSFADMKPEAAQALLAEAVKATRDSSRKSPRPRKKAR